MSGFGTHAKDHCQSTLQNANFVWEGVEARGQHGGGCLQSSPYFADDVIAFGVAVGFSLLEFLKHLIPRACLRTEI